MLLRTARSDSADMPSLREGVCSRFSFGKSQFCWPGGILPICSRLMSAIAVSRSSLLLGPIKSKGESAVRRRKTCGNWRNQQSKRGSFTFSVVCLPVVQTRVSLHDYLPAAETVPADPKTCARQTRRCTQFPPFKTLPREWDSHKFARAECSRACVRACVRAWDSHDWP